MEVLILARDTSFALGRKRVGADDLISIAKLRFANFFLLINEYE